MGTSVAPAPMLPGLADEVHINRLIDSFVIEEVGHLITVDRMPAKDERELLQYRNNNLVQSLRRCDMAVADLQAARKALALLFQGYPSLRSAEVDDLLNAYLYVLQQFPLFAIREACRDVVDNRITDLNPDWPPTSPRMAKCASDHVARVAARQIKIDKILRATKVMRPPDEPGARDRIAASLKDFHGRVAAIGIEGLSTAEERERITARQRQEARQLILREWAHLGLSPIWNGDGSPMSPALARSLGRLNGPEAAIR